MSKINLIIPWIQSVVTTEHNHKQVGELPRKSDSASLSKIGLTIPLEWASLPWLMTFVKSMTETTELVISVKTTAGVNAVVSGVVATGGCGGGFENCVLVVLEERGR